MPNGLLTNNKQLYDVKEILNKDKKELDYLFKNSYENLEKLTVIEAERQLALENLRKLTIELQTKSLRYKTKSACKYFTL
jgi:hypothetical protein